MEQMAEQLDLTRHMYIARGGFAAPFFSWLGVFMLVMVFYTLSASAPMLGDIVWQDAARFATGWWSTAFGGRTSIGDGSLSLMPLTITAIVTYANFVVFHRRGIGDRYEFAAAVLSQVVSIGIICLIGQAQGNWWTALFGSAILGAAAAAWAGRERLVYDLPGRSYVAGASRRLRWLAALVGVLTGVVTAIALIAGWANIVDIHSYYVTGVVGSLGLILIQLAYLPAYGMWALAWLIGPGFSIGEGTRFSAIGVESAPLPAIPVLGALPTPTFSAPWAIAVVVVAVIALAAVVERRFPTDHLKESVIQSSVAGGIVCFAIAVLSALSSGAIGPERMSDVGPDAAVMFGVGLLVIGLPFVAGSVCAHPTTAEVTKAKIAELKERRAAAGEKADGEDTGDKASDEAVAEETPDEAAAEETPDEAPAEEKDASDE